jgi:hypothetical protein
MSSKSKALKGYKRRDAISHRTYSRKTSIARFKKTGKFNYVGTRKGGKIVYGLGHQAGEEWGEKKEINPESITKKYSKNSPSFDEGVYNYKLKAKSKALEAKKQ